MASRAYRGAGGTPVTDASGARFPTTKVVAVVAVLPSLPVTATATA
jgi:hypothetical protein